MHIGLKLVLLSALFVPIAPAQANEKTWATASDVGAYGLTAVALGLPLIKGDMQGAFQAAGSVAAASLITTGLKEAFPELRPDGSDRKVSLLGIPAWRSLPLRACLIGMANRSDCQPWQSPPLSGLHESRRTSIIGMMSLWAQGLVQGLDSLSLTNPMQKSP